MRKFSRSILGVLVSSLFIILMAVSAFSQDQVAIPRVELMPNQPSPYVMRDWKTAAMGYDSLVYNMSLTGTYLPLSWSTTSSINYPGEPGFGIVSYVGGDVGGAGEGINVMPSVIGATLVGIDKSNQGGKDYVKMCRQFYNSANGLDLYLNNPSGGTGGDWWYETMTNVFFYELYDLYPSTPDFSSQFVTVADRWLSATVALGGATTPWTLPSFNYKAFDFSTMTPTTGWTEPEAAGAIGWILYNAWRQTGQDKYRVGAEWSLEYLASRGYNPSYELQMPYGVYIAARMNAELGTSYDIDKMVNWVFNESAVRGDWGVVVGNWGGYDVNGLVGEIDDPSCYPFLMNGMQTASTLIPMVRYDNRFARAIGKWALNFANSTRLFYTPFLPDSLQDGSAWTHANDPSGVIGHEAIGQSGVNSNGQTVTPFATGDATYADPRWANTNFALYGSSHIGFLGGIVDTTDVPMILQFDARKTDWFQDNGYPSYLYYNPYDVQKSVSIDVGGVSVDIWDAVSNTWIATGVSGSTQFNIAADAAMLLVLVPNGATSSIEYGVLYADGIPVDYTSGTSPGNRPPRIQSFASETTLAVVSDSTEFFCKATDPDGDVLNYTWTADAGSFSGTGSNVFWKTPVDPDTVIVQCIVGDGNGLADTSAITMYVVNNRAPEIQGFEVNPSSILPGQGVTITCLANDPDGQDLAFHWTGPGLFAPSGASTYWQAPATAGVYTIHCTVTDPLGLEAADSTNVLVGDLVLNLTFSGNCNDSSPFGNNGTLNEGSYVEDRHGIANAALYLNGASTNRVTVPNSPSLNFTDAVTLAFWMTPDRLPISGREYYVVSHGSWENRWKVTYKDDGYLRWSVKTDDGVVDLDSNEPLALTQWLVVATYGDGQMKLYLNGGLNSTKAQTGSILTTGIDLLVGQKLPDDTGYNFPGILDEVRVYNRVLSDAEIQAMMDVDAIEGGTFAALPDRFSIARTYPNPFNDRMTMVVALPGDAVVQLVLYNMLGQRVREITNQPLSAGYRVFTLDATGLASGMYMVKLSSPRFGAITRRIVLLR